MYLFRLCRDCGLYTLTREVEVTVSCNCRSGRETVRKRQKDSHCKVGDFDKGEEVTVSCNCRSGRETVRKTFTVYFEKGEEVTVSCNCKSGRRHSETDRERQNTVNVRLWTVYFDKGGGGYCLLQLQVRDTEKETAGQRHRRRKRKRDRDRKRQKEKDFPL